MVFLERPAEFKLAFAQWALEGLQFVNIPKNRAMSKINAIPMKAVSRIHTGCGMGIPDHLMSAMTAQQTMTATATHTRIPRRPPVDGMTTDARMMEFIFAQDTRGL